MTVAFHSCATFLIGFLVSFCLTPLVRSAAFRVGAVDFPGQRRPHKQPTARGGGLAVVVGVHAACLLALVFDYGAPPIGQDLNWWKHFVLASLLLLVVGIVDDLHGLRPWFKLIGQALAAMLMCASGLQFGGAFGIPLSHNIDSILVVLWIVGVINAFNLIDGLDGLASGLAIISAIGLGGVLVLGHPSGELIVLVALIGACLGFLRYNFHPASIFLGDTGSMFLGFTLGVVSLQTLTKNTFFLSFCIPLLVLGVPIFDEILAIWRRSVRAWLIRSQEHRGAALRLGLMQPDVEHLHHRLLKAGLSTGRVAGALCAINAGLVLCGLLITVFHSQAAGIFLITLLAAVYVLLRQLAVIELRDTGKVILRGLHQPTHATFKALVYPVWDMVIMSGAVALAMWIQEGPSIGFWHRWFLDLPLWVTPTFSLLAASRVYVTVWTRCRPLDLLMLASTLWTGLVLSLAIALLVNPLDLSGALLMAFRIGAISHPLILLIRVFYRLTEECVLYLRNRSEVNPELDGFALYGAGARCQLYLKERGSANSRGFDGRPLAGLIDDEPSLRGQWVYGYRVLGGINQLPAILARHRIEEIIVTTKLRPENAEALKLFAAERTIRLSEWTTGIHPLELDPAPSKLATAGPPVPAVSEVRLSMRVAAEVARLTPSPTGVSPTR
jgi:UDP-GlcNAc:undecaprenyl-phosphate GlcNAc-1-phosphate transferase